MAIKVTNKEVDVENEIMQKLSEIGLTIDFNPDDEDDDSKEEKTKMGESELKVAQSAAGFLSSQMEI